jgi:hypothetical protein
VAVQALLVPILAEVDRYGLKAWHLRKVRVHCSRHDLEPAHGKAACVGVGLRGGSVKGVGTTTLA